MFKRVRIGRCHRREVSGKSCELRGKKEKKD